MRNSWVVMLLLGMGALATAQETRFNLLDDKGTPAALVTEEDQDKKKQEPPEMVIDAQKLKDDQPIGPYRRPVWTLHRASPQTRIYLQVDPGEVEFEQWLDIRLRKKRSQPDDRIRLSEEFEFGLGGRFQLDIYYNTIFSRNNGQDASLQNRSWAGELRYALADWGVIWGNPTLYFEYILWNNDPNGHGDEATSSIEPKLLLGDDLGGGWHWGANFFYERTLNNSVREHGVTYSLLKTLIDGKLSAGLTAKFVYESDNVGSDQSKTERSRELYIGPNFQIRLAPVETETEIDGQKRKVVKAKAHLDIEPIFGCTGNSDRVQILLIFGWDF
jgi:Putative MetA-pathway of phenol degradation